MPWRGPPSDDWTLDDLVNAADELTSGDVHGLAMPVKDAYWWFGFRPAMAGRLRRQRHAHSGLERFSRSDAVGHRP